jgi:hypothetical protein
MKIGIIGAGNVGSVLAQSLTKAGHDVALSASSPDSPRLKEAAARSGATAASAAEATASADLVILAIPFAALDATLTDEVTAALADKILIDVTNPVAPDYMSLTIGHTTSAGEQVAARLPRTRVVKAFSTIAAPNHGTPVLGGNRQLLPVAGDDEAAKQTVLELGTQLGFDAVNAGPLQNARYLEPMTELLVQLGYGQGMGTGIGFVLARA